MLTSLLDPIRRLIDWFEPEHISNVPAPSSTKIIVKVGDNVVGAIQSFKSIECLSKHYACSVKIYANRVRFDKLKVSEAFGKGFIHPNAQRLPFQITVENNGESNMEVQNAWVNDIGYAYDVGDYIIADNIEFEAEFVKIKKP